jgi:hypothetical protein
MRGRGPWYDEVLVEAHDDGTVTILPATALPLPGRQIWRKTDGKDTAQSERES